MRRFLTIVAAVVLLALVATDVYLRLFPVAPASAPRPTPVTPRPVVQPTLAATATASPTGQASAEVATPAATVAVTEAKPVPPMPRSATKRIPAPRPAPPQPTSVPPRSLASPAPVNPPVRTFVVGQTAISSASAASPAVPPGFEPGGVAAKPAPKIAAQVDFDVQPRNLRAGDAYTVKIYLRNEGKKTIRIRELRVGSSLNGARSESAVTAQQKDVAAAQVALLAVVASTWKDGVQAWGMDATVRSAHGESYQNSVSWR